MTEFLDLIQPDDGLTEIRSILKGHVVQGYYPTHNAAQDAAEEMSRDGYDAFYGVLPRMSLNGADVPAHTPVLWADLDAKSEPEKYVTLRRLLGFSVPPSVIVDSGHGYHAYWRLRNFVQWQQAELAMRGLAKLLHGDHVYDAPRILRLPGTMNWKDAENPVPVRLIQFDSIRRFSIGDFERFINIGHEKPRQPRDIKREHRELTDLPIWLQNLIDDGAPQGTRSEQSFKVMCSLLRAGWTDDEIRSLFQTAGIGEKYREKGRSGDRWFDLSMHKAHLEVT